MSVTRLALDLHTDLTNVAQYQGNPVLVAALIHTAEEKIAVILAHLAECRAANGMTGVATIIDGRRVA